MKKLLISLFVLISYSTLANGFTLPKLTPLESNGGRSIQPCLQWWNDGRCAVVGYYFEFAGTAEANQVIKLLEIKINELEIRLKKLEPSK